jgi:hypothetical protein
MVNDILPLDEGKFGEVGSVRYQVAANASAYGTGAAYVPAFRAGEPVFKALGASGAVPAAAVATGTSAKPVVATDYMIGIASSGIPNTQSSVASVNGAPQPSYLGVVSTETASVAGLVYVTPISNAQIYIGNADVPATYGYNTTTGVITQATYDALVGSRVLMKMSADNPPKYTILASDSATNGLVVENLDITKYPGKVAFTFRGGLNYLA